MKISINHSHKIFPYRKNLLHSKKVLKKSLVLTQDPCFTWMIFPDNLSSHQSKMFQLIGFPRQFFVVSQDPCSFRQTFFIQTPPDSFTQTRDQNENLAPTSDRKKLHVACVIFSRVYILGVQLGNRKIWLTILSIALWLGFFWRSFLKWCFVMTITCYIFSATFFALLQSSYFRFYVYLRIFC